MVFTNLGPHEKDAFFSLLDEYFASRPEIFAKLSDSNGDASAASEATSKLVTAGLRSVPKSSPYHTAASNPQISAAVGRVAAASLAFSANNRSDDNGSPTPGPGKNPPAPPPRRSPDPSAAEPKTVSGLVPTRKFGDVDMSSGKNMFSSLRNSTANKSFHPPPPAAPAAFTAKKNTFAPPPVRRVSNTSDSHSAGASTPPPPPPPARPREPEEEGEWAEVIYDYTGDDPGDLDIQENQRIKIVERTSEDWWTGEVNGRRGLFPASYVKVV